MSRDLAAEWAEFDTALFPMEWGRSVYTVIRLPRDLADRAGEAGTHRLEGYIEDEPVNVGIARANVMSDAFIYVGKSLRRRLGSRSGDVVRCRLRPVDPDVVPVPDDVGAALAAAGADQAFLALPAPQRRRLLMPVESSATDATRAKRIRTLLREFD